MLCNQTTAGTLQKHSSSPMKACFVRDGVTEECRATRIKVSIRGNVVLRTQLWQETSVWVAVLTFVLGFRYNVCVLAYGQTGCGKSYTMLGPHSKEARIPPWGPHSDLGIMPRAAGELFRLISENPSKSLKVDVSIVEVYNNDILDLLAKERRTEVSGPKRDAPTSKAAKREVSPPTRQPVHSAEDFIALAAGSLQLRAQLATQVHARSSRSHLIITATLTAASPCDSPADRQSPGPPLEGRPAWGRVSPGSPGAQRPAEQVHAKLQLVDLAGSECVGVSGVTGSALRETSFINRSLAALADVLGALSERRGHIPYRNSQLTHFLQDVLGNVRAPQRPQTTGPPGGGTAHSLPWGARSSWPYLLGGLPGPPGHCCPLPEYFQRYSPCCCALGCLVCTCLASPPSRSSAPRRAASASCVPACRARGGLQLTLRIAGVE
nr:kinesin-like protein KIF25 isoform X1 [Mirounga angustirostris]